MMFLGALEACLELDGKTHMAQAFYINSSHEILFLNDSYATSFKRYQKIPIPPIRNIDTFLSLHYGREFEIFYENDTTIELIRKRKKLTYGLYKHRYALQQLYKKLQDYINPKTQAFDQPFLADKDTLKISYHDQQASVELEGVAYEYADYMEFSQYIMGGWFEEYIYLKLQKLIQEKQIIDCKLRVKLSMNCANQPEKNDYQEFDLLLSDGKQLFTIECKSGFFNKNQDRVQNSINKLSAIAKASGGITAQSILLCALKQYERLSHNTKEKLKKHKIIWMEQNFIQKIERLIDKPVWKHAYRRVLGDWKWQMISR